VSLVDDQVTVVVLTVVPVLGATGLGDRLMVTVGAATPEPLLLLLLAPLLLLVPLLPLLLLLPAAPTATDAVPTPLPVASTQVST
jgi:hypothetical protein